MGIGASVLLIAIGAILTFALNVQVGFLDLDVVGWVLMAAGVVGLIFTTLIWGPRRRGTAVTRETTSDVDPTMRTTTPRTTEYRRVEERDRL
jgi:hypothetical protein